MMKREPARELDTIFIFLHNGLNKKNSPLILGMLT